MGDSPPATIMLAEKCSSRATLERSRAARDEGARLIMAPLLRSEDAKTTDYIAGA